MATRFSVTMFTDGACSGNPGIGGWAALIQCSGHEKLVSGAIHDATNNKMELVAIIEGIRFLKHPCNIDLYTDSQVVIQGMQNMRQWLKAKKPHANMDLWMELIEVAKAGGHHIIPHKVEAHAGQQENERVDKAAKLAIKMLA